MFSVLSAVFPGENSTQLAQHVSSLGSNSILDAGIAFIRRSTASPDAGIALIDRQAAGRPPPSDLTDGGAEKVRAASGVGQRAQEPAEGLVLVAGD